MPMRANNVQEQLNKISNPYGFDFPTRAINSTLPIRPRFIWQQLAKCTEMTVHESELMFFGRGGRPKNYPDYKRYCDSCPVLLECRAYAIVHKERGIWGGTTRDQRENLPVPYKNFLTAVARVQGWFEARTNVLYSATHLQTQEDRREDLRDQTNSALEELADFFGLEEPLGA